MAIIVLQAREAIAEAQANPAYFYSDLQQVTKDIQTQVLATTSAGAAVTQAVSTDIAASIQNPAATDNTATNAGAATPAAATSADSTSAAATSADSTSAAATSADSTPAAATSVDSTPAAATSADSSTTAATTGGNSITSTAQNGSGSSTLATGSAASIDTDNITESIQIDTSFLITGVSSSPVGIQSTSSTIAKNSGAAVPIHFSTSKHSRKFQLILGLMLLLPILM